ncbi:transcriptional regulator [Reinekea thalattae]|uniref:OmpR/PhoB-type domain-containing protein n=1 Tax=Reinekea thalattae TaxID=2593301 RepID=A0A5C8Z196_9GAMM|nr:winged helix-turn-helix domain-containing protein [Reinekea thalattae]TXR51922.1 hypothetical protein FME95_10885 [Reinekea thalattae]
MASDYRFRLFDNFLFDSRSNSLKDLTKNGAELSIGNNESRLLAFFCQNENELLTRQMIQQRVWLDQGFQVDDSSLTQAIFNLRKLLNDSAKSPNYIVTLPKQGYRFIAQVEPEPALDRGVRTDVAKVATTPQLQNDALGSFTDTSNSLTDTSNSLTDASDTLDAQSTLDTQSTLKALTVQPNTDRLSDQQAASAVEAKKNKRILLFTVWPSIAAAFVVVIFSALLVGWFYNQQPGFITVSDLEGVPIKTYNGSSANQDWSGIVSSCLDRYGNPEPGQPSPEQVIITGDQDGRININLLFDKANANMNVTMRLLPRLDGQSNSCSI